MCKAPLTLQALGDNRAGNSYVDAVLGGKLRVAAESIFALGVRLPVSNTSFQPDGVATVGVEQYF